MPLYIAALVSVTMHFNLSGQTRPKYLIHELATGMAAGTGCNPGKMFEIAVARR
jgi:hypothetical protein